MIRTPRTGQLSVLTLTVLLVGTGALLAPADPESLTVQRAGAGQAGVGPAGAVQPVERPETGSVESAVPSVSQVGADRLTDALTALAASQPKPNRDEMLQAFAAAGLPADAVEVSQDITPTGLAVDSVRGAAIQKGECLFGEVRDGQVDVSVLPVLDSGFCFVGDQR